MYISRTTIISSIFQTWTLKLKNINYLLWRTWWIHRSVIISTYCWRNFLKILRTFWKMSFARSNPRAPVMKYKTTLDWTVVSLMLVWIKNALLFRWSFSPLVALNCLENSLFLNTGGVKVHNRQRAGWASPVNGIYAPQAMTHAQYKTGVWKSKWMKDLNRESENRKVIFKKRWLIRF